MSSKKWLLNHVFCLVSSSILVYLYNTFCINIIPNLTVIKGMLYSITVYEPKPYIGLH